MSMKIFSQAIDTNATIFSSKILCPVLSFILQNFYCNFWALGVENDTHHRHTWGCKFFRRQLTLNATIFSSEILGPELSLILQNFYSYFWAFVVENDKHPRQIWG